MTLDIKLTKKFCVNVFIQMYEYFVFLISLRFCFIFLPFFFLYLLISTIYLFKKIQVILFLVDSKNLSSIKTVKDFLRIWKSKIELI